jgi:hypothetical protein
MYLLLRWGIFTIGGLIDYSPLDLLCIPQCGDGTIQLIQSALAKRGIHLKGEAPAEQLDGTPLEALNLTVRAYNGLVRQNVKVAEQLTDCTEEELMSIRHFGPVCVREVRAALGKIGLALSGEEIWIDPPKYDLDPIAKALIKAGTPGIIAKPSVGGNSFLLQRSTPGGCQLALRRPPARSELSPHALARAFYYQGVSFVFDPDFFLTTIKGHGPELARSRITSIFMIDVDFAQVRELVLREGKFIRINEYDASSLSKMTFTGKHWILVSIDR